MASMYLFFAVAAVAILWSAWGYVSSQTEQSEYLVLKCKKDYEIRMYPPHIVAQTVVEGTYQSALTQGFRIVAGYIFGGNTKKERIAMTAPVVEQKSSESIAMTAPVLASIEGESHVIAFGMPRSYTLDSLPTPTDPRVQIVAIPEKKIAAMQFSWSRSDGRVQSKKQELLDAVNRDDLVVRGGVQYAGYNAPWTPPWMTRNEVLVEVE